MARDVHENNFIKAEISLSTFQICQVTTEKIQSLLFPYVSQKDKNSVDHQAIAWKLPMGVKHHWVYGPVKSNTLDSILCLLLIILADIGALNTFFWVNMNIEYIVFKCLGKTEVVAF